MNNQNKRVNGNVETTIPFFYDIFYSGYTPFPVIIGIRTSKRRKYDLIFERDDILFDLESRFPTQRMIRHDHKIADLKMRRGSRKKYSWRGRKQKESFDRSKAFIARRVMDNKVDRALGLIDI